MSGKGRGPAIRIDLSTTKSCVGEIIPNDQGNRTKPSYVDSERLIGDTSMNLVNTVPRSIPNDQGNRTTPSYDSERLIDDAAMNPVNTDAKKQEDDEEAKQLLVDMIVNETIRNTSFMEQLSEQLNETKVDVGKNAWDEKRKQEKEELKKKREELKKKREERQNNKQDKAMGKKNK